MGKLNREKIIAALKSVKEIISMEIYQGDPELMELLPPWEILRRSGPRKKVAVLARVPIRPEMTPKGMIQTNECVEVSPKLSHANYPLYRVVYGIIDESRFQGHGIEELKEYFRKHDMLSYLDIIDPRLYPPLPPKHWDHQFLQNTEGKGKKRNKKKDKRTTIEGAVADMMKGRTSYVYPPDCKTEEQRRKYRSQQRRLKKKEAKGKK